MSDTTTSTKIVRNEQTYWNRQGKHEALSKQVQKLIPLKGGCEDASLEIFRLVTNAYYDIYNNGACNPCRFADLREVLVETPQLPFTPKEWFEFNNWLEYAADDDRSLFYLFNWAELPEEENRILQYFEKLADWSILNAQHLVSQ